MSTPRVPFADVYFAFLLSGHVGDFVEAARALGDALDGGASMGDLQGEMDSVHSSAELMRELADQLKNPPGREL